MLHEKHNTLDIIAQHLLDIIAIAISWHYRYHSFLALSLSLFLDIISIAPP